MFIILVNIQQDTFFLLDYFLKQKELFTNAYFKFLKNARSAT